ncbi:MAG: hypothetical protein COA47_02175 [Robiginitomaculum sp.]|nr:MAG: hypothetical protein COA47_02175 [Robiginitomaculum sp.]
MAEYKSSIFSLPTKEEMWEEAENYHTIKFYNKSKNLIIVFLAIGMLLSLWLTANNNVVDLSNTDLVSNLTRVDVIYGFSLYAFFLIFVFFNHRWAIILVALIYTADKVLIMIGSGTSPIGSLIFLAILLGLSYRAFFVASNLKKIKKQKTE